MKALRISTIAALILITTIMVIYAQLQTKKAMKQTIRANVLSEEARILQDYAEKEAARTREAEEMALLAEQKIEILKQQLDECQKK